MEQTTQMNRFIHIIRILTAIIGATVVLFFLFNYSEQMDTALMDYFTTDFFEETGAQNAVAGILLNYRIFDTLFEALMLMVSVMEVINISSANSQAEVYRFERDELSNKNSEIIGQMIGIIYPFILLIGLFIIVNGHVSPGGGFQGGAILATGLISYYLVYPNVNVNLERLETVEESLYLIMIVIPIFYIFMQVQPVNTMLSDQVYMVVMNILIGFKVFSGLSIIFYRFVYFEGR